ncbi:MAG: hypothetical protein ACKVS9_09395 [Phycisphaerae bacterium]
MTISDYAVRVVDALDSAGVPYFLTGALVLGAYGPARATKDLDFVIDLGGVPIARVAQLLGDDFVLDPQIQFETITSSAVFKFDIRGAGFIAELFLLGDDPFMRERFGRRYAIDLLGRRIAIPTAEDIIVQKIRWFARGGRPKDRSDAAMVLTAMFESLDWPYIRRWAAEHETTGLLEELIAEKERAERALGGK